MRFEAITVRGVLALVTVCGLFGLFYISAFVHPVDPAAINTATPLGALVLGWYFGSSQNSEDKSKTIADQLGAKNDKAV